MKVIILDQVLDQLRAALGASVSGAPGMRRASLSISMVRGSFCAWSLPREVA
jgi:hypothetical protein